MSRKSIIAIFVPILLILLAAAAFFLFNRPDTEKGYLLQAGREGDALQSGSLEEHAGSRKEQAASSQESENNRIPDENAAEGDSTSSSNNVVVSEEIPVVNNTPEYGLKASLCSSEGGIEFIRLEFYSDGEGVSREVTEEQIPEIDGIFEKRTGLEDEYEIDAIYLNIIHSKVYFLVKGRNNSGFTEAALYSLDLKENPPEKLYSAAGKFTGLFLSKNNEYLGFSFCDNPAVSAFQENSLLQIIRCKSDDFIVKNSRTPEDTLLGGIKDSKHIYDYEMLSWHSDGIARLRETVRPKKDLQGNDTGEGEGIPEIILYNVEKNVFLNNDGTIRIKGEGGPESGGQETQASGKEPGPGGQETGDGKQGAEAESEPVKTLKRFYACLASENDYAKALDFLSDDFTLELGILKQFGVDRLGKKDIDIEEASVFSGILRQARLESILAEETKEGDSTIYAYQTLGINGSEASLRIPVIVRLKKAGNEWKITAAVEADAGQPPFKSVEN